MLRDVTYRYAMSNPSEQLRIRRAKVIFLVKLNYFIEIIFIGLFPQ